MKKLNFKKLMAVISLLATTASVASLGVNAGLTDTEVAVNSSIAPAEEHVVGNAQQVEEQQVANAQPNLQSNIKEKVLEKGDFESVHVIPPFSYFNKTAAINSNDSLQYLVNSENENLLDGISKIYVKAPSSIYADDSSKLRFIDATTFSIENFKNLNIDFNPINHFINPKYNYNYYEVENKQKENKKIKNKKIEESKPKKVETKSNKKGIIEKVKSLYNPFNFFKK